MCIRDRPKILIVDRVRPIGSQSLNSNLEQLGYVVDSIFTTDVDELLGLIKRGRFKCIFFNLDASQFVTKKRNSLVTLKIIKQEYPNVLVLGITSRYLNAISEVEILRRPLDFEHIKKLLGDISANRNTVN